jgi:hypothetical protein
MVTIANIDVTLGARTDKFDAGLNSAAAKSKRFKDELRGDGDLFGNARNSLDNLVGRFPGIGAGKAAFADVAGAASSMGVAGVAAAGAVGVAVAGIAISAVAASIAINKIGEQMAEIDATTDAAKRLGMSFSELIVLRRSIGESTGMDDAGIDAAMQKLVINLQSAEEGSEKLQAKLSSLGVDAGQLLEAGPIERMRMLTEAMQGVDSHAERLNLAFQLFGKSGVGLVAAFEEGQGKLEEMVAHAHQAGLALSDAQAEQVGAANDAWQKVTDYGTGAWRQIAAEVSPVMTVIADQVLGVLEPLGGWQVYLRGGVDQMAMLAGTAYDLLEIVTGTSTALANIATGDFSAASDAINSAMAFDSGEKFVAALNEARKEAAAAADEAERNRQSVESTAQILQEQEEAKKEAAKESKRIADEAARAEEQRTNRIQSQLGAMREQVQTARDIQEYMRQGFSAGDAKDMAKDAAEWRKMQDGTAINGPLAGEVKRLQEERKALEQHQKHMEDMQKRAEEVQKTVTESDPKLKLEFELQPLQELLRAGMISQQQFMVAAGQAVEGYMSVTGLKAADTVQAGSKEAYKLMVDEQNKAANEQEKSRIIQESMLDIQREQLAAIQNMAVLRPYR